MKRKQNTIQKNRHTAYVNQNKRCYYCNQPMWEKKPEQFSKTFSVESDKTQWLKCTAEHVIAKQDGGNNSKENIVAACLYCNRYRHQGALQPKSAKAYKSLVSKKMRKGEWHSTFIS
ncbi:HNH endonuclease signature motif containing protein [Acinetobacter sp. VNH17]|uniref:HNH endonuclease signature motif containing protein n=1 Tax=Acinetobacter thutiue TaxID=2998078 RepID=A0ABT7WKM1_9GAMM|nr:HNH endonuclease signature motif containing protein [Acinetobacter thutiue]MCY6411128.1 HNH endonuclease signature motif containing protein [Acinetobacter thutiue]MDN0013230.1 HNH endonuclease signature motif containing protein [Acinetobacter thutiue]